MKRPASLITAFALAFQATGLALASTIPPPSLGEVRKGLTPGTMSSIPPQSPQEVRRKCSAGILPAPVHAAADRMIEMVDGTGTTTWDYWDDGQVKVVDTPQGVMLYDYYATTGRLQELTEVISGGTNIVTTYTYYDNGRTATIGKFGETTTFQYDEASRTEKMATQERTTLYTSCS